MCRPSVKKRLERQTKTLFFLANVLRVDEVEEELLLLEEHHFEGFVQLENSFQIAAETFVYLVIRQETHEQPEDIFLAPLHIFVVQKAVEERGDNDVHSLDVSDFREENSCGHQHSFQTLVEDASLEGVQMGREDGSVNVFAYLETMSVVLDGHGLELVLPVGFLERGTIGEVAPEKKPDFGGNALFDDLIFDCENVLLNQQFPVLFLENVSPVLGREELADILHLLQVDYHEIRTLLLVPGFPLVFPLLQRSEEKHLVLPLQFPVEFLLFLRRGDSGSPLLGTVWLGVESGFWLEASKTPFSKDLLNLFHYSKEICYIK